MSDRIIRDDDQLLKLTGLSRSTRYRLEASGDFPRRRQISIHAVGWLESEVHEWIGARPRCAEAGPVEAASRAHSAAAGTDPS